MDSPDVELRCHEVTGKVEARCIMPQGQRQLPAIGAGIVEKDHGFGIRGLDTDGQLDSPLELGMCKREISFSTQMVRRAVSFILNDGAFENDIFLENSCIPKTPQTAIAA